MTRLLATTALSLALAAALPSAQADARPYWYHGHGGYYGRYHGWNGGWGPAVGAGIAGLVLGGLLSAATAPVYAGPVYYDYPDYGAPVYDTYPVYYGYGAPSTAATIRTAGSSTTAMAGGAGTGPIAGQCITAMAGAGGTGACRIGTASIGEGLTATGGDGLPPAQRGGLSE